MLTPKQIDVSYRYLRRKCGAEPDVAVVLGSGIPPPALEEIREVRFAEVPHLAAPTTAGHRGAFLFGRCRGVRVAVAEGRLHLFEGLAPDVVTLPIRLFSRLGCRALILTGAVGSLREGFAPGDVVLLRDHLHFLMPSPLTGAAYEEFGPRFVAPASPYDEDLRARALREADDLGLTLKEAVYVAVPGPQYETGAEVRALAALGGDVVGMSVANEALVARQEGLAVLGLCAVANVAGRPGESHGEVLASAEEPGRKIASLLEAVLSSRPTSESTSS